MRRSLLILLAATSLLVAGCGTSGGDDAAPAASDSTTTSPDGGATTSPDKATTTTKAHRPVSQAQLESIMPTAADIGPDYEVKASTDDPTDTTTTTPGDVDPSDKAFEDACPKAKALDLMTDEANPDEATVEFSTNDDRGIEVDLDPTPGPMSEEKLDQIIDAFNDCGTVSYTDPDTGKVSMKLSAKKLEGVGDYGVDVSLNASMELFQIPITIGFRGYIYVVDGVGVTVTASDGLDPSTFETTPSDQDLLPKLAAEMTKRVKTVTN